MKNNNLILNGCVHIMFKKNGRANNTTALTII